MKKIIYLYAFLFSFSLSAQDLYWYDVFLDVKGENAKAFEEAVNNYYSSIDFPEGVNMTFSSIPLKGQDYKETHILSFVSPTSSGLAEIRGSLTGDEWDDYVDIVRPSVESVRAVAGTASMLYNEDQFNPIGQAWCFKVKSKDIPAFSNAYNELMKSFNFPGFVGLAQVSHGISNGENIFWNILQSFLQRLPPFYTLRFIKRQIWFVGYTKIFCGINDLLVKFKYRILCI